MNHDHTSRMMLTPPTPALSASPVDHASEYSQTGIFMRRTAEHLMTLLFQPTAPQARVTAIDTAESQTPSTESPAWRSPSWLLILGLLLLLPGCSREFWRRQADRDSYRAIEQHVTDGRWQLPRIDLSPDPRSRFYDPYSADCPPLPPDDPAAATYMQCADGLKGYKSWHKLGQSVTVENPVWLAHFEITEDMVDPQTGTYSKPLPAIKDMTLQDAIELSYIHSRDYQTQLENLYLAALDLTFERFQFQVRYLGLNGQEPTSNTTYTVVPSTPATTSLGSNNRFGISQLLPTGGQWAVEFANNTLWLFSPNSQTSSASLLSFSLVQPLMLGAGRKIAMEGLTQTERTMLYAVRNLARFRKQLFTNTVTGGNSGSGNSPGYLGLLTQLQSIRNQQDNIRRLERQVNKLKELSYQPPGRLGVDLDQLPADLAFPDDLPDLLLNKLGFENYNDPSKPNQLIWFGEMSEDQAQALMELNNDAEFRKSAIELMSYLRSDTILLDVAQLESQLRSQRNTLRTQFLALENSLDQFKIFLGLPPDIFMTLDDSLLKSFEFIDPRLIEYEDLYNSLILYLGSIDEENPDREAVRKAVLSFQEVEARIGNSVLELLQNDFRAVEANIDNRLAEQESEEDRAYLRNRFSLNRDAIVAYQAELEAFRLTLQNILERVDDPNISADQLREIIIELTLEREENIQRLQSLQVVQIDLRVELIELNRVSLSLDDAVGLALENRMDLMNQRALVVDARRRLEVSANRLKAVMDLIVEGDVRTPTGRNSPLDFRGNSSSIRAGVAFRAPIDQVAERNEYKATQIDYQRARRAYMLLEDQIKFQVRVDWRQLKTLEANLETARQALRFAALSYDQAVLEASDPTLIARSSSSSSSSSGGGSRSSGLSGQNILTGLRNILQAQNQLINIWTDYETARLNIFRDMEVMVIDERGIWVDNFYQNEKLSASAGRTDVTLVPLTNPVQEGESVPLLPPEPMTAPMLENGTLMPLIPGEPTTKIPPKRNLPALSGVDDSMETVNAQTLSLAEIAASSPHLTQTVATKSDAHETAIHAIASHQNHSPTGSMASPASDVIPVDDDVVLQKIRLNQPDPLGWVPVEPAADRAAGR